MVSCGASLGRVEGGHRREADHGRGTGTVGMRALSRCGHGRGAAPAGGAVTVRGPVTVEVRGPSGGHGRGGRSRSRREHGRRRAPVEGRSRSMCQVAVGRGCRRRGEAWRRRAGSAPTNEQHCSSRRVSRGAEPGERADQETALIPPSRRPSNRVRSPRNRARPAYRSANVTDPTRSADNEPAPPRPADGPAQVVSTHHPQRSRPVTRILDSPGATSFPSGGSHQRRVGRRSPVARRGRGNHMHTFGVVPLQRAPLTACVLFRDV